MATLSKGLGCQRLEDFATHGENIEFFRQACEGNVGVQGISDVLKRVTGIMYEKKEDVQYKDQDRL